MDILELKPEIRGRHIRVRFEVGGRTLRTHLGERKPQRVHVSLIELERALTTGGEVRPFNCDCGSEECSDDFSAAAEPSDSLVLLRVQMTESVRTYQFDREQAEAEVGAVRTRIAEAVAKSHGREWLFHPPSDADLFENARVAADWAWYVRNNVLFFLNVAGGAAGFTWLIRSL